MPADLAGMPQSLLAFNRRVIDATSDLAAAYKPQIAFYSALGREEELAATIRYAASVHPMRWSYWTRSAMISATRPRLMRPKRSTATGPMPSP